MAQCFCCRRLRPCFLSEEEKAAILIDRRINKTLREEKRRDQQELKLLLLGPKQDAEAAKQFILDMYVDTYMQCSAPVSSTRLGLLQTVPTSGCLCCRYCATDTHNIHKVFRDVREVILVACWEDVSLP